VAEGTPAWPPREARCSVVHNHNPNPFPSSDFHTRQAPHVPLPPTILAVLTCINLDMTARQSPTPSFDLRFRDGGLRISGLSTINSLTIH